MKRTTVTLPDELAALLEREAKRNDRSISTVIRQALLTYFGLDDSQPRPLPFADLGDSGYRHTARDMEEILADEWTGAADRCSGDGDFNSTAVQSVPWNMSSESWSPS